MKKIGKLILFIMVVILSFSLRMHAANTLKVDADETVYINSAIEYTNYLREGKWTWLAWSTNNFEHPALVKIIYGFALLSQEPTDQLSDWEVHAYTPVQTSFSRPWLMVGRYISMVFGTLAVAILAIINPLAGFFLGIDTINVQYTSEMYLEALPLLTSLLAFICYLSWMKVNAKKPKWTNYLWLFLSSVFLGMTAASKYVFTVVGIAIITHYVWWLIQKKIHIKTIIPMIAWGSFSILAFFFFDPYLWPHPFERLVESLTFHSAYTSSISVTQFNYPFYQPFIWLSAPISSQVFSTPSSFIFRWDTFISIFALIGLPFLFRINNAYFLWLIIGLIFLLAWPTKWPQYTMIIMVPYSMSAAEGVFGLINAAKTLLMKFNLFPHKTRG